VTELSWAKQLFHKRQLQSSHVVLGMHQRMLADLPQGAPFLIIDWARLSVGVICCLYLLQRIPSVKC